MHMLGAFVKGSLFHYQLGAMLFVMSLTAIIRTRLQNPNGRGNGLNKDT